MKIPMGLRTVLQTSRTFSLVLVFRGGSSVCVCVRREDSDTVFTRNK